MKFNLKIKILGIVITISTILLLTWLIMNRNLMNLLEKPLSAIGNIPTNYLMFFLGSAIVFYFVMVFLIKIHLYEDIKFRWYLFVLPVLILLTLLIPYRDEYLLGKVLHTIAGVLGAILLVFVMYQVNKFYFPENPIIKKITNNIPTITIIGTITLFITTGLNTIMELFYLGMSLIWINLTAFSKPNKAKKR